MCVWWQLHHDAFLVLSIADLLCESRWLSCIQHSAFAASGGGISLVYVAFVAGLMFCVSAFYSQACISHLFFYFRFSSGNLRLKHRSGCLVHTLACLVRLRDALPEHCPCHGRPQSCRGVWGDLMSSIC